MTTDPLMLQEAAPSLLSAGLRAGGMILALIALAIGWIVWQRRSRGGERRMKIEDRLVISRAASVVLMEVDGQRLLVGVSPEGIRLLQSLPAPTFASVLKHVAEPTEVAS